MKIYSSAKGRGLVSYLDHVIVLILSLGAFFYVFLMKKFAATTGGAYKMVVSVVT